MRGLGNKFLGHSKENNVCIKQAQDFDEYFMVVYRIVCDDYSVVLLLPLIDLNQFMFFFYYACHPKPPLQPVSFDPSSSM